MFSAVASGDLLQAGKPIAVQVTASTISAERTIVGICISPSLPHAGPMWPAPRASDLLLRHGPDEAIVPEVHERHHLCDGPEHAIVRWCPFGPVAVDEHDAEKQCHHDRLAGTHLLETQASHDASALGPSYEAEILNRMKQVHDEE